MNGKTTKVVQDLIAQVNREYAERQLVDTAKEKINEMKEKDVSIPWLEEICTGIVKDLDKKPREFWK